jgi:CRP/FNR family cyclic AMP-dependent transcriptional regulator
MAEDPSTSKQADTSHIATYRAGAMVLQENEISRSFFVVKSGKVRVFKNHNGRRIDLSTLGPGEIFGEMSFFDRKPRSASVEVVEDNTTLITVQADTRLEALPEWVRPMFSVMLSRMRMLDERMVAMETVQNFQKSSSGGAGIDDHFFSDALRVTDLSWRILETIKDDPRGAELEGFSTRLVELLGPTLVDATKMTDLLAALGWLEMVPNPTDRSRSVRLKEKKNFIEFAAALRAEIEAGRRRIMTAAAIKVLSRLTTLVADATEESVEVSRESLLGEKEARMPDAHFAEGVEELAAAGLVRAQRDQAVISVSPAQARAMLGWQQVLRRMRDTLKT